MRKEEILQIDVLQLLVERPYLHDFFRSLSIEIPKVSLTLKDFLACQPAEHLKELHLDQEGLIRQCLEFLAHMEELLAADAKNVDEITIKAGHDKNGEAERWDLIFRAGEVVCVVGPTGSGKSRLLGDIESLAQRDTPSGRQVLIDGRAPDEGMRFSGERQLVAQLSQNMNFVVDLSVEEFITMHAESRLCVDIPACVEQVFATAVELAGEPFARSTPVTALSGGQSRALMIADVACLSVSPIVLIDEIENAGVDRLRALELLVKKEKIVLLATHDPLLALSGDRRLIIRNGGVVDVITTNPEEREVVQQLAVLDSQLGKLRQQIRTGERVYTIEPDRIEKIDKRRHR